MTCSVRLGVVHTNAPAPHPSHTPTAFILIPVWVSDSPKVVPVPAAPAPPGNVLEIQIHGPFSGDLNQNIWGWGPGSCLYKLS